MRLSMLRFPKVQWSEYSAYILKTDFITLSIVLNFNVGIVPYILLIEPCQFSHVGSRHLIFYPLTDRIGIVLPKI